MRGTGEFRVTNYERIKKMSIEEMQKFLRRIDKDENYNPPTFTDEEGRLF